jgi:hypothetical protein
VHSLSFKGLAKTTCKTQLKVKTPTSSVRGCFPFCFAEFADSRERPNKKAPINATGAWQSEQGLSAAHAHTTGAVRTARTTGAHNARTHTAATDDVGVAVQNRHGRKLSCNRIYCVTFTQIRMLRIAYRMLL